MDPWDEVICIESILYDKGLKAGQLASIDDSEIYESGNQAGYKYSYLIGFELGYMESILEAMDRSNNADNDGVGVIETISSVSSNNDTTRKIDDACTSSSSVEHNHSHHHTQHHAASTRLLRRRIDTLQRCRNVPLYNNKDYDFVHEMTEIRSLFKQCQLSSSLG